MTKTSAPAPVTTSFENSTSGNKLQLSAIHLLTAFPNQHKHGTRSYLDYTLVQRTRQNRQVSKFERLPPLPCWGSSSGQLITIHPPTATKKHKKHLIMAWAFGHKLIGDRRNLPKPIRAILRRSGEQDLGAGLLLLFPAK